MRRLILTTIGLLALANTGSLAGDLPSRYAPPPVIGGGPGTKVGVLNCKIAPHLGLIVVGFQNMQCRFTSEGPAPSENYVRQNDHRRSRPWLHGRWRSDVGGVRADQKHDARKPLGNLCGRER